MSSNSPKTGSSAHATPLLLVVHRQNGHLDQFHVRPGLTIGRSPTNNIVLAGDLSVDKFQHACVDVGNDGTRLRCVTPNGRIVHAGALVSQISLDAGTVFDIGQTRFECVQATVTAAAAPPAPAPAQPTPVAPTCPYCGTLVAQSHGTPPCPACGEAVLWITPKGDGAAPLVVPRAFGSHFAERFVARGGMGIVLKGRCASGSDTSAVAIKLFDENDSRLSNVPERFQQEIEAMTKVRHPNVLRLLDCGKSGRFDYLITEWINGPNLRDVITRAHHEQCPIDFRTAAPWLTQICEGLAAIHDAGLIHRDLKPSNILIDEDNHVRIADLGLAKSFANDATCLTTTGQAPGTLAYMAPEQINAPDSIDHRADLYSLGVLTYELLTGERPMGAWRPASTINATVPPAFDAVLHTLLQPSPAARYSGAQEVLRELNAIMTQLPPIAEPASTAPEPPQPPPSAKPHSAAAKKNLFAWMNFYAAVCLAIYRWNHPPVKEPVGIQPAVQMAPPVWSNGVDGFGRGGRPNRDPRRRPPVWSNGVDGFGRPPGASPFSPAYAPGRSEPLPTIPGGQPALSGSLSKSLTNSIGMKLTLIPAGEFLMGSSESADETLAFARRTGWKDAQVEYFEGETPLHRVRLSQPFYLGTCEVTLGEFRKFVEATGYKTEAEVDGQGGFGYTGDEKSPFAQKPGFTWRDCGLEQSDVSPVINVSWNDAVAFCDWLSRMEGGTYRLPTEAEWEYACRGGTNTRYNCGDDPEGLARVGNVADAALAAGEPLPGAIASSDGYAIASPVGSFKPNAFGLYDMHGNVWEWCADWYDVNYYGNSPPDDPQGPSTGSARVARGGGWVDCAANCRSASHGGISPSLRLYFQGFRVARSSGQ